MPAVVVAASAAARSAHRAAIRLVVVRLSAGLLAAAFALAAAAHPCLMPLAWASAALFATAFLVEVLRWLTRPDRRWHGARAIAEAGKSAAWSYAAGAVPFDRLSPAAADAELLSRLGQARLRAPGMGLPPDRGDRVPASLAALRALPESARRDAYLEHRLGGQQAYYADCGKRAASKATLWRGVLVASELGGLLFALLWASGAIGVDASGVAGAALAAAAAWLAAQQYDALAPAYLDVHQALTEQRRRMDAPGAAWPELAAHAERVLAAENQVWLARRS